MKLPWLKTGLCLFLRHRCLTTTQTQVIKSFQLFLSMQFFHMVVKTSPSLLLNNFWKGLSWVFLHTLSFKNLLPISWESCTFCLNNFCSSFLSFSPSLWSVCYLAERCSVPNSAQMIRNLDVFAFFESQFVHGLIPIIHLPLFYCLLCTDGRTFSAVSVSVCSCYTWNEQRSASHCKMLLAELNLTVSGWFPAVIQTSFHSH